MPKGSAVYIPVKATEHAMKSARNEYMQKVCLDCANGVEPAPLAEQEFTKYFMKQWSDRQMEWRIPDPCSICHGAWPTRDKSGPICRRCNDISKKRANGKSTPKQIHPLSSENGMVPNVNSAPPDDLPVLTELEEMFIARIHPVMAYYRKKSGHSVMKGHCANVYQDHTEVLNSCPGKWKTYQSTWLHDRATSAVM